MDIDENSFPFDEDLISASVDDFEQQLIFLSKYCNVLTFKEIGDLTKNKSELPPNATVITFDDGFFDNYVNAFPLLMKYGLKAVFFISTDYIDTSNFFWFDLLAYLGKKQLIQLPKKDIPARLFSAADADGRILQWKRLREYMINTSNQERLFLLNLILRQKIQIKPKDVSLSLPLTWKQVREMYENGMEIGSHTMSHLVLGNATKQEIDQEIKQSKSIIEEQISSSIQSISYPIAAQEFTVNDYTRRQVKKNGYQWGISYFSGTNYLPHYSRFMLKRLKVERYTKLSRFKSQLFWPKLMAY